MARNIVNPNLIHSAIPAKKRVKRGCRVVIDPMLQPGCGCTEIEDTGKVASMRLAATANAFKCFDRCVPLHELLHARYTKPATKAEKGEFTHEHMNAVEDMSVHGVWLPWRKMSESQRRDWVAMALLDLRQAKQLFAIGRNNEACYMLPRAYAVLMHEFTGVRKPTGEYLKFIPASKLSILPQMLTVLNQKKPDRAIAIRLYKAMLEPEKEVADGEKQKREPQLRPESSGGAKIELTRLPLVSACDTESPRISIGTQGGVLHPGAMIRARTAGKLTFVRVRKIEPQGTVLIDASGSMRPDIGRLTKLCTLVPGATVIYYNGAGEGGRTRGNITIFAERGRRAGEVPYSSLRYGGNSIDSEAMELAFQYPGPYTLVSDCQFIGGVVGGVALAEAYVSCGRFKDIYSSLDGAIQAFSRPGSNPAPF